MVSQNQRALHIVFPHQFLDSPEWFGVSTDDYFQVNYKFIQIVVIYLDPNSNFLFYLLGRSQLWLWKNREF